MAAGKIFEPWDNNGNSYEKTYSAKNSPTPFVDPGVLIQLQPPSAAQRIRKLVQLTRRHVAVPAAPHDDEFLYS